MKKKLVIILVLVAVLFLGLFVFLRPKESVNNQADNTIGTEYFNNGTTDKNETEKNTSNNTDLSYVADVVFPESGFSPEASTPTYVKDDAFTVTTNVPLLPYTIDSPGILEESDSYLSFMTDGEYFTYLSVSSATDAPLDRRADDYLCSSDLRASASYISMREDSGYLNGYEGTFRTGYITNVFYTDESCTEKADAVFGGYYVIYEFYMPEKQNVQFAAVCMDASELSASCDYIKAMVYTLSNSGNADDYVEIWERPLGNMEIRETVLNGVSCYTGTLEFELTEEMDEMYFVFTWSNMGEIISATVTTPEGFSFREDSVESFRTQYVNIVPDAAPGVYTYEIIFEGPLDNAFYQALDKERYYAEFLNMDLEGNPIRHL